MSIGIWQIVLIIVVVLLLFGAGKLPRLMGDFAKGIKSALPKPYKSPQHMGYPNVCDLLKFATQHVRY